ncbi:MAG: DUF488 domain-containing protein [Erysipelotrichaceae bacterium]|nr:DUF488 domain-containing protein [Erysipelotrichaceae bacterium]
MNSLRIKRIYELGASEDGYRILVDRIWPRGIKKEQAHIFLWAKELAPSNELRKWFGHDPSRFEEFAHRYEIELEENSDARVFAHTIQTLLLKNNVTLLYGAKDEEHNQAVVLRDWVLRHLS